MKYCCFRLATLSADFLFSRTFRNVVRYVSVTDLKYAYYGFYICFRSFYFFVSTIRLVKLNNSTI